MTETGPNGGLPGAALLLLRIFCRAWGVGREVLSNWGCWIGGSGIRLTWTIRLPPAPSKR
jgi:hypothetical protein